MFAALAVVGVIALVLGLIALGGWLLALAWNFVAPIFWAGAPHLTWLQGAAINFIVATVGGVFGRRR